MRILPWLFRRRIRKGLLTLTGPDGFSETFTGAEPGPSVAIHVSDPSLDWKILLNPQLRFTEAYMDGVIDVTSGNLRDLLMLYWLNRGEIERGPVLGLWNSLFAAAWRFRAANTLLRARHNAAHHYDIGNELYRLFLDADMQYSCAYFPKGNETLEEAQLAKKRHIAAKLMLRPGQRVLDIGCGWGGMALYLAQVADVEVLGITLAEEQLKIAREHATAAGLSDRVRFERLDYRNVEGRFDRIVSVGMMEHVGPADLGTFFDSVRGRLMPRGVALIHSIMTMKPAHFTDPFIKKYIFPGGYLPLPSETLSALERTGLWLLDFEVWRKHYAFTLRKWHERFMANRDTAKAMYDERFCRMWELYLLGFEPAFLASDLAVMQLQIGHERDAVPLARDYLAAETQWLKALGPDLAA